MEDVVEKPGAAEYGSAVADSSHGGIQVHNLTKSYGGRTVVSDLSFDVAPGRVTGLLGPNGSGKTTTMRCAVGLTLPDRGSVSFGARERIALPITGGLGWCLERNGLDQWRSVRSSLRTTARALGQPLGLADDVMERVGLGDAAKKRLGRCSLGMKQRVAVAQVLLGDPQFLILDEPMNGLDPEAHRWLRDLLRSLAADGRSVLVSSHMLNESERIVDDVVLLAFGRAVYDGSLDGWRAAFEPVHSFATPAADHLARALTHAGLHPELVASTIVAVPEREAGRVESLGRADGIPVADTGPMPRSLESMYVHTVARLREETES